MPMSSMVLGMGSVRDNQQLGAEIARLRNRAGLQQEDLSRPAGLDQTAMSKVEIGARGVSAAELVAFAGVLGVQPEQLLMAEPAEMQWRTTEAGATDAAAEVLNELVADFFAYETAAR